MTANERQLAAGRAWAHTQPKPAQGSRDAWARFDAEETRDEQAREDRGGNA